MTKDQICNSIANIDAELEVSENKARVQGRIVRLKAAQDAKAVEGASL